MTEHPCAGSDVALILTARDEAGNEGQSAAFEFRLPERPMARALVEQRRILALDADAQASVLTALDAPHDTRSSPFAASILRVSRSIWLRLMVITGSAEAAGAANFYGPGPKPHADR